MGKNNKGRRHEFYKLISLPFIRNFSILPQTMKRFSSRHGPEYNLATSKCKQIVHYLGELIKKQLPNRGGEFSFASSGRQIIAVHPIIYKIT